MYASAEALSDPPNGVSEPERIRLRRCRLPRCPHPLPLPSSDCRLWGLFTRLRNAEALQLFSALQRIQPSLFQEFSERTNAHTEKEHTEITACSTRILQKFLASCICGISGTASALTSPDLRNCIKGPHLNRSLLAEGVKFRRN